MWATIGAVATALAALLGWWVHTNPRRRRERLLKRIRRLEDDMRAAVAKGDASRIAALQLQLKRLREDAGLA